jgi:hypothetical protein
MPSHGRPPVTRSRCPLTQKRTCCGEKTSPSFTTWSSNSVREWRTSIFELQHVDGRLSTLLQLLSTYQEAPPAASEEAPSTASDNESCRQQGAAEDDEEPTRQEVKQAVMATDKQEQIPSGDAEVVKEPVRQEVKEAVVISLQVHIPTGDAETAANKDACTGGDDMQWATSGTPVEEEPWPGYLPEYVPDYTPIV